ncbi:hypothetical protein EC973_009234 [Apophysomyces ossiformis]|uniref:26S proteasome non-ATPase regulatory subunit 5 n=1 Tax=Apophysomyces ossiformis TaxID=679940 RepID=A0A8H7BVT5_9FUNG|nr:hypothetical protein EC973_009234 [Apophysomyces ossiformis]
MSPATIAPIERAAQAIRPDSTLGNTEKADALRALSVSLGEHPSADQATEVLSVISLPSLYNALSTDDEILIDVVCDLIEKLFRPFPYDGLLAPENKPYLLEGLTHFTPSIRHLSLTQVEKCLSTQESVQTMVHSEVFPLLLATLAFQDTRTANKAVDVVYRIAGSSDHAFRECERSGLLHALLNELTSEDLLLKLNAIETLSEIAATANGVIFLEKANLLKELALVLDREDEDDVAVVLTKCAVLKFFGKLGEDKDVNFESIEASCHLLVRLQHCLDSANKEILVTSIASIGLIGSHANGLRLIHGSPLKNLLPGLYRSATSDVKCVVLQSLSKLIAVRDQADTAVDQMTRDIYQELDGRPTTLQSLTRTAKDPSEETRTAAFALMQAIATHIWGCQDMAQSDELINYLLDRTTEHTLQGQTWKYAIVETITTAPNAQQVLGNNYHRFLLYVRQGPYYRVAETTAATENV